MSQLDQMIAWENGELDEADEADLFQALVESGQAWTLQGMYGRRAATLLADGRIAKPLSDEERAQLKLQRYTDDRWQIDRRLAQYAAEGRPSAYRVSGPARVTGPSAHDENDYPIELLNEDTGEYEPAGYARWVTESRAILWGVNGWWELFTEAGKMVVSAKAADIGRVVNDYRGARMIAETSLALTLHHARFH